MILLLIYFSDYLDTRYLDTSLLLIITIPGIIIIDFKNNSSKSQDVPVSLFQSFASWES